ncbi:hypothetical protein ACFRAO_43765 [Streptomyces sp. NPDC056656]|uniref:hypothetical protein n=1 Tax=Streptomyces sp. NPDC056656 TaxID=3345895 RepID=UPI0036B3FE76
MLLVLSLDPVPSPTADEAALVRLQDDAADEKWHPVNHTGRTECQETWDFVLEVRREQDEAFEQGTYQQGSEELEPDIQYWERQGIDIRSALTTGRQRRDRKAQRRQHHQAEAELEDVTKRFVTAVNAWMTSPPRLPGLHRRLGNVTRRRSMAGAPTES